MKVKEFLKGIKEDIEPTIFNQNFNIDQYTKERKAKEAEIEAAEKKVSDLKERISRMVQEHGYPDGQAFMAAYNKAESIVKRYEWELAEWKQQVEGKPTEEKKPPERKSVLEKLHRIREEAQKPQKRSARDREER